MAARKTAKKRATKKSAKKRVRKRSAKRTARDVSPMRHLVHLGILHEEVPAALRTGSWRSFWSAGLEAGRRSLHVDKVKPTPENVADIYAKHFARYADL